MNTHMAVWSPLRESGCRAASTPNTWRPTHSVTGPNALICHNIASGGSHQPTTPVKTNMTCANSRQNNPK